MTDLITAPKDSRSEPFKLPSGATLHSEVKNQLASVVPRDKKSKEALGILRDLADGFNRLSYADFRMLGRILISQINREHDLARKIEAKRDEAEGVAQKLEGHRSPATIDEVHRFIDEKLRDYARDNRPSSLRSRLIEQQDWLEGKSPIPWGEESRVLDKASLSTVQGLIRLLDLHCEAGLPVKANANGLQATPEKHFAEEMMRLLRLSVIGGVNLRQPSLSDPKAGVFTDFDSLQIYFKGARENRIKIQQERPGVYRISTLNPEEKHNTELIAGPGEHLMCGREGGIPFDLAGVQFQVSSQAINMRVALGGESARTVSRAALDVQIVPPSTDFPEGGVVLAVRCPRHEVIVKETDHSGNVKRFQYDPGKGGEFLGETVVL